MQQRQPKTDVLFGIPADELCALLAEKLAEEGRSPAFTETLLQKHSALLRLLAETDVSVFLSEPASPARCRQLFSAAFAQAFPAEVAEKQLLLSTIHRLLKEEAKTGGAIRFSAPKAARKKKPESAVSPAPAGAPLPTAAAPDSKDTASYYEAIRQGLPRAETVLKTLQALREEPRVAGREQKRLALFAGDAAPTAELFTERVRFVRKECGVSAPSPEAFAPILLRTDPAEYLKNEPAVAVALLEHIARRTGGGKRSFYPFAVDYCACIDPARFPFINRKIESALSHLRENAGFYPYLNTDLRQYKKYIQILSIFNE